MKKQDINGLLLLDKPVGITSNAALQAVKKLFWANKAGHTGSLDPLASGMLIICFGDATKFSQFLLEADKTYRVTGQLGIKTATADTEGEIIEQHEVPPFTRDQIEKVLQQFRGEISQIPSMYSAIKHQGRPLYELARQGKTVEREARKVTIHRLELIAYNDNQLELDIDCSKGTYVRNLVEDIGDVLGCCAHVTALRRKTIGRYQEQNMITLAAIEDLLNKDGQNALNSLLLPIESAFDNWQKASVSEAAAYYLHQGQAVIVPYAPAEGMVRLVMKDGRFLGVGEVLADGKVAPRRLIF
jgi:tRNA pseudouridine55 synthase